MNSLFSAYSTNDTFDRIRIGDVSQDQSTIAGKNLVLFLYAGSNNYYSQYIKVQEDSAGVAWAELTANRHKKIRSEGGRIISLFVPNKVTCMPDLYPLPINNSPTKAWCDLESLLKGDTGMIFSNNLITKSKKNTRSNSNLWRYLDSHWTEFGCLLTANELLTRLGLNEIKVTIKKLLDPIVIYGDLSSKYVRYCLSENCHELITINLPSPVKKFDSGANSSYTGNIGRKIFWENLECNINLHLLIVGNSFSGSGDSSNHLTFWMARVFRRVTFIHSPVIPTDVMDSYSPDIIIFQGLERFFTTVPIDNLSSKAIESLYKP
jgi:hypothetical protein